MRNRARWLAGGAIIGVACGITAAAAQPGVDRVLSRAAVAENDRCAVIDIAFNYPVRVISSFPAQSGNQLDIRLQPADGSVGLDAFMRRETLAAPRSTTANIRDIEFDGTTPVGPDLTILFTRTMFFRVGQTPDFRHVLIAVSGAALDPSCTPDATPAAAPASAPVPAGPPELREEIPLPGMENAPLLDQARAALTAKDYDTAIKLLTKLLSEPESPASQEAQELIGIARERNGQLAHAKAEYEEYLRRYPTGEGADRVRQRLAALLKSALAQATQGRAPQPGATGKTAAEQESPWFLRGSLSEYFYHDQLKSVVTDDNAHVVIDNGFTTLQSQLVSSIDADAGIDTGAYSVKLRVSAAESKNFLSTGRDETFVGQFYLEAATGDRTLLGRIGRQYRTTGGMLGRYDGFLVSYQPLEHLRAEILGGFPVDSSRSSFNTQRRAIGGTLTFLNGPWNADIYGLYQTDHGILDRLPVGVEGRYVDGQSSLLGLFEYDVHFNDISVALFNGTMNLGHTAINVGLDYRRAPLLRTSDALIGQPVSTLDQLLQIFTEKEIHQLALDRTAKSESGFVGITQQFDDQFSLGFDATIWNLTGMPASGGVPAIPAMGTEYYFAGHLVGTSLLMDGDMGMATLGYSSEYQAHRYTIDLNTRFPLMHELRVGPRIFASYRETTGGSARRYTVRPTIRLNYRAWSNVELEFEGGAELEDDVFTSSSVKTWDFITNLGLRVDF